MIVGHGAIARVLPDHDGRIYFASGVADSSETRESEYERERTLLSIMAKDKRLVYFSSLCIFTSNTRYSRHKRMMEEAVRANFPQYTIMRLGNIDWGDNTAQLIPFIKNCLKNKTRFRMYDAYRHILSLDEFTYWIGLIPDFNCEMNITGERMKVNEIIERYQNSWRVLA